MKLRKPPAVSVILPTFNREAFLRDAVTSIRAQSYENWELLIVDDGSTDSTRAVIEELLSDIEQPTQYLYQENKGAYGARNKGLENARGEYIAFFDSDDLWMPHHLGRCMHAFSEHPDLDWVYGSCQMVDHVSGRVMEENIFYPAGRPRPFLSLNTRPFGNLRIIDDPRALKCQLTSGLYCGLQNSVISKRLFADARFCESLRVVEDVMFLIRALASGMKLAYYPEPHVVYRMHEDNSSASGTGSQEKALAIFHELVVGYEQIASQVTFPPSARRALNRRLAREYFWHLGYQGFWISGRREEALVAFRRGIACWPWDLRFWKTYVLAMARTYVRLPVGALV